MKKNPLLAALGILLGAALGNIFLYAGLMKHLSPYAFSEAVLAYRLGPPALAGVVAAVLPWLELTVGFFLVLGYLLEVVGRMLLALGAKRGEGLIGGIKRRSCLLLIMVTMAGFVVVLAITMARGLKIDCGCGLFFQRQVGWAVLLEDTLLFLVTAGLYWWELPGVEEVKE